MHSQIVVNPRFTGGPVSAGDRFFRYSTYRIAGNFRGNYISLFSRIFDTPRKLNLEYFSINIIMYMQYGFHEIKSANYYKTAQPRKF